MGLETLELVERRQIRIVVVEMHHKADGNEIVVVMIEERAATGLQVERPAERMLDHALLVLGGIDLPDFLEPDAEFRRLALGIQRELRDELFGQAAARAFREQRVLAEQFHATGKGVLRLSVPADAHVASGNALHRALLVIEYLGGGKARIDLDAERLCLAREPAADIAER